jgi:hypothetical protein
MMTDDDLDIEIQDQERAEALAGLTQARRPASRHESSSSVHLGALQHGFLSFFCRAQCILERRHDAHFAG